MLTLVMKLYHLFLNVSHSQCLLYIDGTIEKGTSTMKIPTFLRIVILRISPPCSEITFLASKAMVKRLSFRERWRLHLHFAICTSCRIFNIQIHALQSLVQESWTNEAVFPDETLSEEARTRIQSAIVNAMKNE